MQAIHLVRYGNSENAFEIREINRPEPSENEVCIKVEAFGINFADVVARRGLYPDAPKNPAILGYDVAGTVDAIGANVSHVNLGDRVTALTRFGGYAQYATTMSEGVARIPEHLGFAEATVLSTQGCTAYFCAIDKVTLHKGDIVLIHAAAGGVGSILVQIALSKGCIVIGTASCSKRAFLKELGVHYIIDYTKENLSDQLRKLNLYQKINVVFDSIGGYTFKQGMKALAPGGSMISFGAAEQIDGNKTNKLKALKAALGFGIFSPIQLLMKSQSIIGVNMLRIADHQPKIFQECLNGVIAMYESGIIKPNVNKVFKATEIAQAHDYLESRQSIGKIALEW